MESQVNRREFIKLAALSGLTVVVITVLSTLIDKSREPKVTHGIKITATPKIKGNTNNA